ncbi:membrane protein [Streptomyces olivaceus]|uniref:hypothetical protein n=1 Tax=Streptomyces olivaceus TaxID=47716 RepID=UPI0022EE0CC7|nr:hypothetical protein [Streptomyces olivaceus]GHJ01357.1 membrane protein [Streptomyces olivaceus]
MTGHLEPQRPDAKSNVTRLLSAGAYLDPTYRKDVIRELLTDRFRVVAPSYGYDTVPVLAHALAADRLRMQQQWTLAAGTALVVPLVYADVLNGLVGLLTLVWLGWATVVLRRIAVLRILAAEFRPSRDHAGFDGRRYPRTARLTEELVRKIDTEQSCDTVRYGGYKPFVGAGELVRRWSNAELLIGAPVRTAASFADGPLGSLLPRPNGGTNGGGTNGDGPSTGTHGSGTHGSGTHGGGTDARHAAGDGSGAADPAAPPRRKPVRGFTPEEITAEVSDRMLAELSTRPPETDRVRLLSVDRRRFTAAAPTGGRSDDREPPIGPHPPRPGDGRAEHWRDGYDADREYLRIRIGSWDQEIVTTVFVGFDIRGATLHTEFYTYVLAPVIESFHLVDRLPDVIDGHLVRRVAWDVTRGAPGAVLGRATGAVRSRLPRRRGSVAVGTAVASPAPERHGFWIGRYARTDVNSGALTSVREMATHDEFHHFFQETDALKYTQIVERHLLQIVGDFLREHDVDTRDHEANQTNILQQNFGANNNVNFGINQSVGDNNTQTAGPRSGGTREARPA